MKISKLLMFLVLSAISFNLFAQDQIYVGNPSRPDTIWIPAHCEQGCWRDGYYLKFLTPVTCNDLTWIEGQYDRAGNWIPAHWQLRHA